ncbi:MAG: HWE histidine kinase domain-containing protein [Xanthobacteraceae bacterium]
MLRFGSFIGLIALIGLTVSGLVAYRAYGQDLALAIATIERSVDTHARLVQDRLNERDLLIRLIAGLISKSSLQGDVLAPLQSSIYEFKADFVVAGWVARLAPDELAGAEKRLAASGAGRPEIRDVEDQPLDIASITQPLDVLMEVEPQNPETSRILGQALDRHPVLGPLLARAALEGKPLCSDPLKLLRTNGLASVVLVAPVAAREGTRAAAGFLAFSYRVAPLMLSNEEASPFDVVLEDPHDPNRDLKAGAQDTLVSRAALDDPALHPVTHTVIFSGKPFMLRYYARTNFEVHARALAAIVAAIGIALTAVICGMFGYVVSNNVKLSREIDVRIGFENRLTMVIGELNHRVKNILAVLQSIVTRTLPHGADVDSAREMLIGRIHAMSNVVSLLSDSQWQGVKLRGLLESRAIPHADRIVVTGPDISVSPRAAQSLSLLFFELASHADEGLSLVGKHPSITAQWNVTGSGSDAVFDFRWEELNTSAATRSPDSDFGVALLERVAPEALGGSAKRYFTDVSYVYELTAPMESVIDQAELDRMVRVASSGKGNAA